MDFDVLTSNQHPSICMAFFIQPSPWFPFCGWYRIIQTVTVVFLFISSSWHVICREKSTGGKKSPPQLECFEKLEVLRSALGQKKNKKKWPWHVRMTLKQIHNPFHQGKAFYHDGYVESFLTANSYKMKLKPQQNVRGQADGSLTGRAKELPFYTESNKLRHLLVSGAWRVCLSIWASVCPSSRPHCLDVAPAPYLLSLPPVNLNGVRKIQMSKYLIKDLSLTDSCLTFQSPLVLLSTLTPWGSCWLASVMSQ